MLTDHRTPARPSRAAPGDGTYVPAAPYRRPDSEAYRTLPSKMMQPLPPPVAPPRPEPPPEGPPDLLQMAEHQALDVGGQALERLQQTIADLKRLQEAQTQIDRGRKQRRRA